MAASSFEKYRIQLQQLVTRLGSNTASLEAEARNSSGSAEGGNLSSTPMHLGDLGAEAYNQELSATLLENEEYLQTEVVAALGRLDSGTYGTCENCNTNIIPERLEALPYARYCTACAEKLKDAPMVNLNDGRPKNWNDTIAGHEDWTEDGRRTAVDGDQASFTKRTTKRDRHSDVHASGTPGGGTAVGGLAGTNVGSGDPDEAELEAALGSSEYDVELEGNDEATDAYSGPSGGAVGGTPAGKRSTGGRVHR